MKISEEGNEKSRSLKIVVAYDHRGSSDAKYVIDVVQQWGHQCIDLGHNDEGMVDSPDFAYVAAKAVKELKMPQTPIKIAVREAFDWFKENGYLDR